MRTILTLAFLLAIACADMPDEAGPHAAELATLKVRTLRTGYSDEVLMYFPKEYQSLGEKFPVIAFGHGYGAGGLLTPTTYFKNMISLASWGHIVLAPLSCRGECFNFHEDLAAALRLVRD